MKNCKGIKVFGSAIMVYGIYNLAGLGDYWQFSVMFRPLPSFAVIPLYIFSILYGICGVYCGLRILRMEDWARRLMVGLTSVSVVIGLCFNRLVMANFEKLLLSGQLIIPPDEIGAVYTVTVIFIGLVTMFELFLIYYFTRPGVIAKFRVKA